MKKKSYTIPCSSTFRDAIIELAVQRNINVADLARSVVLMVPLKRIQKLDDPGEPSREDREPITLQSGKDKGRRVLRKPRLQVRIMPGFVVGDLRKALGLALLLDKGEMDLSLKGKNTPAEDRLQKIKQDHQNLQLKAEREANGRLQTMIKVLSFEPLAQGVERYEDALYVMGFPPDTHPQKRELKIRFRMLAGIYHPDNKMGDHDRMSQLNQAMEMLN